MNTIIDAIAALYHAIITNMVHPHNKQLNNESPITESASSDQQKLSDLSEND